MSELLTVKVSSIEPNPLRRLAEYPYNPAKIEALRASIRDVGLWEGVIARRGGNSRYQIAFGHHRIEAARQEKGEEARVPLIIRDLSDKEMLAFMGRENLEDYNADFLCMLESWEAGWDFAQNSPHAGENIQAIDVSKLLGWTRNNKGHLASNHTANACAAAKKLIDAGYIKRTKLSGLSVRSASEICEHINREHERIEASARITNRPPRDTESVKKVLGRSGERVADKVRKGGVARKDIRSEISTDAFESARTEKQKEVLFASFAGRLSQSLRSMLNDDAAAEKLNLIKENLPNIEMPEDAESVEQISLDCSHVAKRGEKWARAIVLPAKKIARLKEISNK